MQIALKPSLAGKEHFAPRSRRQSTLNPHVRLAKAVRDYSHVVRRGGA